MKITNCIGYAFVIAIIIVALFIITKRIKEQNEMLTNIDDQLDNKVLYTTSIDEYNKFINDPSKTFEIDVLNNNDLNSGKQAKSKVSENLKTKPMFQDNVKGLIESGSDIILPSQEDIKKRNQDQNYKNKNEHIMDYYKRQLNNILRKDDDNYFIDLGDLDGSLRYSDQSHACGIPQFPPPFKLSGNEKILKKRMNGTYRKSTPYMGGFNGENNGFTCVNENVGKFLECRGNNGCVLQKK
jgi:hypothetical protein